MGFPLLMSVFARTRELLLVPHASGWRWGSSEVGANFHRSGGRGRLNTPLSRRAAGGAER